MTDYLADRKIMTTLFDYSNLNVPLLREAVEWAEAEAGRPRGEFRAWDQSTWEAETACGTTYCIAGYICYKTGYRTGYKSGGWAHHAAKVLGIGSTSQSYATIPLFSANNSIKDIRRIAEAMAVQVGERL